MSSKYSNEYHTLKHHLSSVRYAVGLAVRAARAESADCDELIGKYAALAEVAYRDALPYQIDGEMKKLYANFLERLKLRNQSKLIPRNSR